MLPSPRGRGWGRGGISVPTASLNTYNECAEKVADLGNHHFVRRILSSATFPTASITRFCSFSLKVG